LKFWKKVRRRGFKGFKFYRQFPIFYEFDHYESFFIADFFCFEKRIVIEIDGKVHETRKEQDEERSLILRNLKIRVIRIKNEEIENNINCVLKKLSSII